MPSLNIIPASTPSLIAFLCVVYFVVGCYLEAIYLSERKLGGNPGARVAQFSFLLGTWLGIMAFFVRSGALASSPMPAFPIFFLLMNGGALALGLSRFGKNISITLPLWALVGFQAFRLPLELVLHSWADQGTIPGTMTWTGQNFDSISGILALVCAPLSLKSKAAGWVANFAGIALLLNVARVAVMSSPLPFAWGTEPPLLLAMNFPYVLIVPVCVGGALAGHVILTRALLRRETR